MPGVITVLTVNHDAKRFIDLCIRAVHLRTHSVYEHVVIDNGSQPDVVDMLESFAAKKWITLIKRKLHKGARGHADSLNWILPTLKSEWICLLDSDAHPVMHNWLVVLDDKRLAAGADACGFAHFRDESLLHPSCMLFRLADYLRIGRPSFSIYKDRIFWDTGMKVCQVMKDHGLKLLPLNRFDQSLTRHRWCGTRIENVRGDRLDGLHTKAAYDRETDKWFADPSAQEALKHG